MSFESKRGGLAWLKESLAEAGLWERSLELKRGDWLWQAGQSETRIFGLVSGALRIGYRDDQDCLHTLRLAYTGDVVAALDSFAHGRATVLNAEALRKTQLKILNKTDFEVFLAACPERLAAWQAFLLNSLAEQVERECDLLQTSAKARYEKVWARSPRLFQEVPLRYIAAYLRMSPETLSRLRSKS